MKKCVICKKEFEGFGNNAEPIKEGRCCDECNVKVFIKRIKNIKKIEEIDKKCE